MLRSRMFWIFTIAFVFGDGQAKATLRGGLGNLFFKGCAKHYSCCAQFDFFIPEGMRCVENEPKGSFFSKEKDNCARNDQGLVSKWMRMETPEWRKYGVCNSSTLVVTRADLERKEENQRKWNAEYAKYCTDNGAECSFTETCYYDRTHKSSNGATISRGGLPQNEAACLCEFPKARENSDGTGPCVECKAPPASGNTTLSPYVTNIPGNKTSGAKTFAYGDEFACAFGAANV